MDAILIQWDANKWQGILQLSWGSKVQTLAAQIAKSSLSSNGNNAKDNVD